SEPGIHPSGAITWNFSHIDSYNNPTLEAYRRNATDFGGCCKKTVCDTNVHLADCRKRRNLPSKILRFQGFINFDLLRRYGRFFCLRHIQSKAFARQFLTGIPFVPVQCRAEYSLKKDSASSGPKPF